MSKRRLSERGAGETSGRASKLQCPGISGNNAKRAGPFILGKEATGVWSNPQTKEIAVKMWPSQHIVCIFFVCLFVKMHTCNLCVCLHACRNLKKVSLSLLCMHAWAKNVKNFTDPHDIGQKDLSLCWNKVITSLWKMYFSTLVPCMFFFFSSFFFLFQNSSTVCNAECQRKSYTGGVNGYVHMQPLMGCSKSSHFGM